MKTLAIDIGGTRFRIAAFEGNSLLRRESFATDRVGGRDRLLEELGPAIRQWNHDVGFDRCGIGFGGPVLWDRQIVAKSTHAGGWGDFDLPGWVQSEIGRMPVVMDNDANVGALGEYVFGAGQGCSPLFYMTVSTGIGGGILVDGRALRGADSWAGEIGHINVRPDGPDCLCGSNGCLERMCCGLWLEEDYGAPAKDLMQKPEFVAAYVVDLARGIKAAIMLLNPQRIVIGGGIARAAEALFGPLREELARQMPPWSRARVDVQPAACGDDAILYGALALVSAV
ncbi:MAG TPA: ROK family protein [Bryobacteraceae bacterium]|nr:ROK family protein [Bryobacteraceae bacterium]